MSDEGNNGPDGLQARIDTLEANLGEWKVKAQKAEDSLRSERERADRATKENELATERIDLADERRAAAEKKAGDAGEEYEKAQAQLETVNGELENARLALTEANESAKTQVESVNVELQSAKQELSKAEKRLADRSDFEAKEVAARMGLKDFVSDSLSDIMCGVDEAAVAAVDRHLNSGLLEDPIVSPSRIGQVIGDQETLVHFDLAVVANTERDDSEKKENEKEFGLSAKGSIVVAALSANARFRYGRESVTSERSGVSEHHRVRFSVPIRFASQDELTG